MSDESKETLPKLKNVWLSKGSGIKVSELVLGCMTMGKGEKNSWGMPTATEEASHAMLDYYHSCGGNFLDTADAYSESEETIGTWLKKKSATIRRDDLFIATKTRMKTGPGPNDVGLSRKHIIQSVEASLKKLDTPYIDMLYMHSWDPKTDMRDTFRTMSDLVRAGKVHYIGLSNVSGWQMERAFQLCDRMGLEIPVALQAQYSLISREVENELVPCATDHGVSVLPWSPLCGGLLSGRYRKGKPAPEGSRGAWASKVGWKETSPTFRASDRTWKIIEVVEKIAEETKKTMPQVSLRWLMQKPGVAPLIGAKKMSHLKDNLAAATFTLSPEQMKRLDEASAMPPLYPYNSISSASRY